MQDVTVIGGGVAGCSVSSLLASEGYDVTVIEKDAIGGLLREIEFDTGYHCDSAPHLLFFDEDEEAIVGEFFRRYCEIEPHTFYAKTYPTDDLSEPHDYPVSSENIDRWDDSDQIRAELDEAVGKTDADYFDEFVRNQVGPTLYERYYEHYTRKHWGIDPSRITGDWFDFKISFPDAEESFFDAGAYYPQRKYTSILEDMIADCDVVFDGVTGIESDGSSIQALETESGNRIEGDIFVNTIDPSILVDTEESLNYRSMLIYGVHIEASERLFPDHVSWGYFPNDHDFTRVTDYDFTPQSIPDGEYILTVEFPCFLEDDIWSQSKSWFDSTIADFLADQGIEMEILDSQIRRAPRAYPLPVEEEIETFERINDRLSRFENIVNMGRVSTYEYIWIKDILQQAYETKEQITAATPP